MPRHSYDDIVRAYAENAAKADPFCKDCGEPVSLVFAPYDEGRDTSTGELISGEEAWLVCPSLSAKVSEFLYDFLLFPYDSNHTRRCLGAIRKD